MCSNKLSIHVQVYVHEEGKERKNELMRHMPFSKSKVEGVKRVYGPLRHTIEDLRRENDKRHLIQQRTSAYDF